MAEINADAQEVIALLGQKNSDLAVENAILNARLREAARQIDAQGKDAPDGEDAAAAPARSRKRAPAAA